MFSFAARNDDFIHGRTEEAIRRNWNLWYAVRYALVGEPDVSPGSSCFGLLHEFILAASVAAALLVVLLFPIVIDLLPVRLLFVTWKQRKEDQSADDSALIKYSSIRSQIHSPFRIVIFGHLFKPMT